MISGNIIFSDLHLGAFGGSFPWLVHEDLVLGVHVNTETYLVLVEVIYGVEMTEEGVTYQIEVLVLAWKSAFMNYKVAFALVRFVQVLLWSDLEHVVTHLEAYWFNFLGHVLTW